MKERPFQFRPIQKTDDPPVALPPAWCGAICKNAMSEVCCEHCAVKKDTSYFQPKPDLTLAEMPSFPNTEGMTREERFTSVTIYLAKVVDHLKGGCHEPSSSSKGGVPHHSPDSRESRDPNVNSLYPSEETRATVLSIRQADPGEEV
jgi:hypothetical protein